MKRQVYKKIAVAFIAVLVAFTSCQKEYIELVVENETVEFTINPTEAKIVTIHSNTDWSLEIQQVGAWLSVTPAGGTNDGTLTLTAQVNDDFAERYATITLLGADVKAKTIAVIQQGDKTKDVILLEEIHHVGYIRYAFEYDTQHRLTNRYHYDSNGTLNSTMTLIYNDDDDLTAVLWVDVNGWTIQSGFTKEGNKISFRGVGISNYEIELNTEGLPEKRTHYWRGQIVDSWSSSTHTYKWVNRNLIQTDYKVDGERYGEAYEESGTYTYTYDDKKSPFYHCATPRWFWLWYYFANVTACSLNNLVSTNSADDITTYEYTYNEDGFLATEKQGEGTITYTYKRREGTGNAE
jgi:hypothetical protein